MTEEFSIGKTFKKGPLGQRDAVHAPVVLVSSAEKVYPGDSLEFIGLNYSTVRPIRHPGPGSDSWDEEEDEESGEPILHRQAVADPFVTTGAIPKGQLFWAFLVPGSTEGLRHVFEIKENKEVFQDSFENRANAQDSCRGCY